MPPPESLTVMSTFPDAFVLEEMTTAPPLGEASMALESKLSNAARDSQL